MGEGPAPLYARVKQMIVQQIENGSWPPHHRVPSESELVSELGFSRMTINRALRELTAEGLLVRMQGVGTFVAEPAASSARTMTWQLCWWPRAAISSAMLLTSNSAERVFGSAT